MVRLESGHTFHSGIRPHLVGKVLVIAPDSHFRLVEFHTISVSSAFGVFEFSCCEHNSSSVSKSGLALQLSEERLSTQSSL